MGGWSIGRGGALGRVEHWGGWRGGGLGMKSIGRGRGLFPIYKVSVCVDVCMFMVYVCVCVSV